MPKRKITHLCIVHLINFFIFANIIRTHLCNKFLHTFYNMTGIRRYTLVANQEITRKGKSVTKFLCIYVCNFKLFTKLKGNDDMSFQGIESRAMVEGRGAGGAFL